MNIDHYYMELKNKLSNRPTLLDNTNDFLFVLVNTVKAMIENTDKSQLSELDKILFVFAPALCCLELEAFF